MKEKLINIKLILRIIISVFIIFSCVKSCTKAYTWADFIEFNRQLSVNGTGNAKSQSGKFISQLTKIETNIANAGVNVADYEYFFINYSTSYPYAYNLYLFNGTGTFKYTAGTGLTITGITGKQLYMYNVQENIFRVDNNTTRTNYTFNDNSNGRFNNNWGLVYDVADYGNYQFNNKYTPPIIFEFQPKGQQVEYENYVDKPYAIQNSYSNTTWNIGEFIEYAEYSYIDNYLFDNYGNTVTNYRYFINTSNNQNSNFYVNNDELYIKSSLLSFGKIYTLALYCYDNEENMDSYTYNYIFLPLNSRIEGGIITDFGSGDFNIQDSTNTEINFWENTIGKIFDNSSGDNNEEIRNKVESFYNEIGYTSGDVSGELMEALAGLDVINSNFGDFKISWGSYNPNLTVKGEIIENEGNMIPSGEINFSKFERENPAIQEVMRYVRAILSFSIFIMLGKNFWNTLMLTLGISPSVYDKATEEERILNRNEENWKQQFEKQRYREWLRKNQNRK